MKIKVFVVDDEYLQRELVKKTIDWKALDMELCGEAEDGREALAKALEMKPDIVVMDINIPHMNGIEVSRKVKEVLPDTQVIILTAYGEFSYAREALAFGAASFVLKPVDPVELEEELKKSKEKIEQMRRQENSFRKMREKIGQKEKEQFLMEQISGIVLPEENREVWNALSLSAEGALALLFLRLADKCRGKDAEKEIEEMIQDYFPDYERLEIHQDYLFVLFGGSDMEFQLQIFCAYLQEEMNQKQDFWGGMSLVHDCTELREAYTEAYAAAKGGENQRRICLFEPVNMADFLQSVSYEPEKLLYLLRKKEYQQFHKMISFYFQRMEEENALPQAAYYVAVDILVHFSLYLTERGIDFSSQTEHDQRMLTRLLENGSAKDIEEILQSFLKNGQQLLESHKLPATKRKVQNAKKFIDENYASFDMSLNLVADSIGVNASYLSNIFKKEWGCSLSKYLNSVRLEQARKLMEREPDKTLIEISEAVGYGDVYYFSKNFKNYYGVTPSKYQEEKQ